MLIHQAYRYELKLNNKARSLFRRCAGTARFAYNQGLAKQATFHRKDIRPVEQQQA